MFNVLFIASARAARPAHTYSNRIYNNDFNELYGQTKVPTRRGQRIQTDILYNKTFLFVFFFFFFVK